MKNMLSLGTWSIIYPEDFYTKERLAIRIRTTNASSTLTFRDINYGCELKYTPVGTNYVQVDITDVVHLAAIGLSLGDNTDDIQFEDEDGNTAGVSFVYRGDRHISDTIIPPYPIAKAGGENMYSMGFPTMILDCNFMSISKVFELSMYCNSSNQKVPSSGWQRWAIARFGNTNRASGGIGLVNDLVTPATFSIPQGTNNVTQYRKKGSSYVLGGAVWFRALDCNRRYCLVKWRSRFGNYKVAVWQIKGYTESTGDTLSLENLDGGMDVRCAGETSATLYLDRLCAYDVWYYQDVVIGGDVQVKMDGADNQLAFEDRERVQVTTSAMVTPDSDVDGMFTLSIGIKLRKYSNI